MNRQALLRKVRQLELDLLLRVTFDTRPIRAAKALLGMEDAVATAKRERLIGYTTFVMTEEKFYSWEDYNYENGVDMSHEEAVQLRDFLLECYPVKP